MATKSLPLPALQSSSPQRITILGAGIVGSALAYNLSILLPTSQIILLDPFPSSPNSSTAIAPGLVGQLNAIPHLTAMAKESIAAYSKIPGGFQHVGGLEIASTKEGIVELERRMELARDCGLEADIIRSHEVARIAPDFHAQDEISVGLFFPGDGIANPPSIAKHYQEQAQAQDVVILPAEVSAITVEGGRDIRLNTDKGVLETNKLVVAAGIWTPKLLRTLQIEVPIVPVAHPYAYGPKRARREAQQPFVRWPERHIYARDHGECDGFGSYDHKPAPCVPDGNALFDGSPDP
jgi:glycine/D-amino acid oxidase-like deaminating enzyme